MGIEDEQYSVQRAFNDEAAILRTERKREKEQRRALQEAMRMRLAEMNGEVYVPKEKTPKKKNTSLRIKRMKAKREARRLEIEEDRAFRRAIKVRLTEIEAELRERDRIEKERRAAFGQHVVAYRDLLREEKEQRRAISLAKAETRQQRRNDTRGRMWVKRRRGALDAFNRKMDLKDRLKRALRQKRREDADKSRLTELLRSLRHTASVRCSPTNPPSQS